ncbi:MAG: hypothetical protein Q8M65_00145 [Rhodoglobus sp.]|nr:hypothetical protein [Rhodoglobus sp.]
MKTTRGVIPLVAALIGVAALGWSFVTGIAAALSGGGSGALPYEIIFIVALAVVLASAVLAIINLVKKRSMALGVLTLVVVAGPVIGVIVLTILNGTSGAS